MSCCATRNKRKKVKASNTVPLGRREVAVSAHPSRRSEGPNTTPPHAKKSTRLAGGLPTSTPAIVHLPDAQVTCSPIPRATTTPPRPEATSVTAHLAKHPYPLVSSAVPYRSRWCSIQVSSTVDLRLHTTHRHEQEGAPTRHSVRRCLQSSPPTQVTRAAGSRRPLLLLTRHFLQADVKGASGMPNREDRPST